MPNASCQKCGSEMTPRANGKRRCRPCGNAYQRAAYVANPELIRARKRDHMARRRSDPEKREQMNEVRRGNPAYLAKNSQYSQTLKRKHFFRWRSRNWGYGVTAKQLASLWKSQRGRCALSGRKIGRDAHLDHIQPASKGGSHQIHNLRWLDPAVNIARGNGTDEDFLLMCSQVAEWIGRRIIEADRRNA